MVALYGSEWTNVWARSLLAIARLITTRISYIMDRGIVRHLASEKVQRQTRARYLTQGEYADIRNFVLPCLNWMTSSWSNLNLRRDEFARRFPTLDISMIHPLFEEFNSNEPLEGCMEIFCQGRHLGQVSTYGSLRIERNVTSPCVQTVDPEVLPSYLPTPFRSKI